MRLKTVHVWGVTLFCLLCAGGVRAEQAQKAAPPGPVTIDLNPAPGDQGRLEVRGVRPGAEVVVEIVALREAKGAMGFTATLMFDPTQLSYEAFEAGRRIPQMQTLPLLREGMLEVGGSQFGGGAGAAQDVGTLGFVRFKTTPRFKGQTAVILIHVRYRKRGEMKKFDVQVKALLLAGAGAGKPLRSRP